MRIYFAFLLTLSWIFSASAAENDPLQIMVSLEEQQLRVYRGTELVTQSNISSGKKGNDTPTGVFSILQKNRHHRSNIYSNAPMPFMQRLTWSGIALHASNSVPNYPASHGCVRLPHSFARTLFKMNTNGMHVVIEQNPNAPSMIVHESLFQPKMHWAVEKKFDPWVNSHIEANNLGFVEPDHRYPARIFITRNTYKDDLYETQRLLNKLGYEAGEVDGIMGPNTWKAVSRFQKDNELDTNGKIDNTLLDALYMKANEPRPANGRLMVRKHHRTVFATQIHIKNPEQPLGSHLLTVSNFDLEKQSANWLVTSLEDRVQQQINLRSGKLIDDRTDRHSINEALDRIQMSKLDKEQVSRLLSPGSSITISDNGMSIETGKKGTDFIVLTKPEKSVSKLAEVKLN